MNGENIEFKDKVKVLGYVFNSKNINENEYIIDSFSKVRKSFFSLNKFGMKPGWSKSLFTSFYIQHILFIKIYLCNSDHECK
jgi:hypothetical protein